MATIKDVAKLAGVSPSTVSRVIAGSNRISLETKNRVRKAMEQLNYVPNAIARSLARSHTHTIGFALSRRADQAFSNPFFSEVMRGCLRWRRRGDTTSFFRSASTRRMSCPNACSWCGKGGWTV